MRYPLLLSACALLAACGSGPDNGASPAAAGAPTGGESAPIAASRSGPAERAAGDAPVRVLEREFVYGATDERNLVGLFVAPEDIIEPLPGVVLVHDWWGLDDSVRAAAHRLAAEGYAVLAVDLYAGTVATTAADAEELMSGVVRDPEGTLGNLRQAYGYLEEYALAPRIAAVGWHLGGTWALESALELGGRLDAVVMYYGQVVSDETRLKQLDSPLLGIFAELDEVVPLRQVTSFRNSLRELHKRAEVYVYSNVRHAFANPGRGAYDAEAAGEAWEVMLSFLDAELKEPYEFESR